MIDELNSEIDYDKSHILMLPFYHNIYSLWTVFKQVENVTNLHRKMTPQGNMLPLKPFPIYRFDTENSALEYVILLTFSIS
jgi:hypothetical protein